MTTPPPPEKVVPLRSLITTASVQGTLALDLQPRHDPPPLTGGRTGAGAEIVSVDVRTRRSAQQWARRFAQAVVEIVGGDRPASQLVRWTTRDVHADLTRRAFLVAQAGGHHPGTGRVQPVTPHVLSVRTCFVCERVVEAGVHVRYGERSRAVAARFEQRDNRWICTALEFA